VNAGNQGRHALVTGGRQGIGLAVGQTFAQSGIRVTLLDIDPSVDDVAAEMSSQGLAVGACRADVADADDVAKAIHAARAQRGSVDILVNSAGITLKPGDTKARIEELALSQWRRVVDVNLTGVFLCCQAVVPGMRSNRWGRIITLSSQGGRTGGVFSSVDYSATKAGVIGFSRTLALELGPDGITVNCVAPGRVATPMASSPAEASLSLAFIGNLPIPRVAEPAEIAAAIAFLASDSAGYITGATLDINGGGFMA
jgi:3-oxoacyl-[acyl-carrier protein] reductase